MLPSGVSLPVTMKFVALVLSALVSLSIAQDLGVPLSWRVCPLHTSSDYFRFNVNLQEFSNSRSLAQRQSIAKTGIDQMASHYNANDGQYDDIGFWPSAATVYSAMSNYDHFTGTTTYKSQVTTALNKAFSLYAHYDEVCQSRFLTRGNI
jgi:hypothetical protein